jgi:hypothetical protein
VFANEVGKSEIAKKEHIKRIGKENKIISNLFYFRIS